MKELDEIEARWARVRDHNDAGSPEYTGLVDASVLDVPQLVKALRAVLELHSGGGELCESCSQFNPCHTLRAIESALASRPPITDEQVTNEQVEAATRSPGQSPS